MTERGACYVQLCPSDNNAVSLAVYDSYVAIEIILIRGVVVSGPLLRR